MRLGDNILKLRKQQGLSQEQLGVQIKVTRQTISNWELEETTPNPEQLKLLSKALNVSVDELIDNNFKGVLETKVNEIDNVISKNNNLFKTIFVIVLVVAGLVLSFLLSKYLF